MSPSNPAYWSAEACAARAERFGQFLVTWRKRCGWTQYEIPQWATAAGFVGPAIGTVSQIERGKIATPTMALFAGLAEVNARLVTQDFTGVSSRKLLDRLRKGVAVNDAAGRPWGFHEFVSSFHQPDQVSGEIWEAAGVRYARPVLTDEELERVNTTLASGFRELLQTTKPLSRALKLATMVAPPSEREAYEEALGGIGYSQEALQRLWDGHAGQWAPLLWWEALQKQHAAGGGAQHRSEAMKGSASARLIVSR